MTYRQKVKARLHRYFYNGDPWMTDAQYDQLMYEYQTPVGRSLEFGTRLHETLEQMIAEPKLGSPLDEKMRRSQAEVYAYGIKDYVGPGTCRNRDEMREADRGCDAYEKQMGW